MRQDGQTHQIGQIPFTPTRRRPRTISEHSEQNHIDLKIASQSAGKNKRSQRAQADAPVQTRSTDTVRSISRPTLKVYDAMLMLLLSRLQRKERVKYANQALHVLGQEMARSLAASSTPGQTCTHQAMMMARLGAPQMEGDGVCMSSRQTSHNRSRPRQC